MNRKPQTASPPETPRSGYGDIAILVAENEKLVAWDIEQTLRDNDFNNVLLATSMHVSRDLITSSTTKVALVILDLKLEDGDATTLIEECNTRDIAVIVVTGYSEFIHADIPVLYKPVTTTLLLETVHACLAQRNT